MERDEAVELIARHMFKHSSADEGGYPAHPRKFRWGQMTRVTQDRFRQIAAAVYDGAVVQILDASREDSGGRQRR